MSLAPETTPIKCSTPKIHLKRSKSKRVQKAWGAYTKTHDKQKLTDPTGRKQVPIPIEIITNKRGNCTSSKVFCIVVR